MTIIDPFIDWNPVRGLTADRMNALLNGASDAGESLMSHSAVGDGAADDSTPLVNTLAAAGHCGRAFVPKRTFVVGDVGFPEEGMLLEGTGMGYSSGSILKAKALASYVLKMQGKRYNTIRDLVLHGNERASRGMLLESTGGATSQSQTFERTRFYRCTIGLHLANTGLTQADKNTLYGSHFTECDVGLRNESVNGQNTLLVNTTFESTYDTAIQMSGGTLSWWGGQVQGGDPGSWGIDFTGSGVDWVNLKDVIFEGPDIDISGSSFWPRDGVTCENVTFQGPGANVVMGVAGSVLVCRSCRFNQLGGFTGTGQITVNAANCVIVLENTLYGVPVIDGTHASDVLVIKPTDLGSATYWRGTDNLATNGDLDVRANAAAARVRVGDSFPLNGAHYPSLYLGNSLDVNLYRNPSTAPTLRTDKPFTLPTYTTASKPAAGNVPAGTIIFVSDGGAGAVFQGSTGAAWVNLG